MQTRSQRQGAHGPQAARGTTDWHALEVQLNRTRSILQEILVHLQEVLKNLKMARSGAGFGTGRTDTGAGRRTTAEARFTAGAGAGTGTRARPQAASQSTHFRTERSQPPPPGQGTAGASDRFRARPRHDASEARTETGPRGFEAGAGDKAKADSAWSYRSGMAGERTTAGAGRERPRAENAWRTRTTGPTGAEREARPGPTAGQRSAPRSGSRGQGFRPDGDRQSRAREAARKNGMNLKCAYDILCLDYPCSADDIKLAYRQMARLHHPDLGGDEEAMKDVNVAYELAMRFCAGARRTSAAWAV
jgi:hypothetical protein